MDVKLPDSALLGEARRWLRERWRTGADCPCCGQGVKLWPNRVDSAMARSLIAMYQVGTYVHLPTLRRQIGNTQGNTEPKMRFWELIEPMPGEKEDGNPRNGWWRITDKGRRFVRGIELIPKYAMTFDNVCYGLDGPMVSIRECLGAKFDYRALMAAADSGVLQ